MKNVSHASKIFCNRVGCGNVKKYDLYCGFECAKFVANNKESSKQYQEELKIKAKSFLSKQKKSIPQIYNDIEQADDMEDYDYVRELKRKIMDLKILPIDKKDLHFKTQIIPLLKKIDNDKVKCGMILNFVNKLCNEDKMCLFLIDIFAKYGIMVRK
jgi:hypothetical protein